MGRWTRQCWVLGWIASGLVSPRSLAAQATTYTDPRDGAVYPVTVLGGQSWLASNLRYATQRGSRCFADVAEHCTRYGRLYSWPSAMEACPSGWHLPTEAEWQALERHLGMDDRALDSVRHRGTVEGDRLQAGGGSGFEAVLGGYMRPDGTPRRLGERAAFWTATEHEEGATSWHRDLSADPRVYRSPVDHEYFLSVRCVSD